MLFHPLWKKAPLLGRILLDKNAVEVLMWHDSEKRPLGEG
jgi:hypothetical protein